MKFCRKVVPDEWLGHFDMLRDTSRNCAYANAVKFLAKVESLDRNCLWIDLGCGSGLLGCLAAKYLGIQVVSIECVPELARIARDTIYRNNLQEYVTVWLMHSSDIDAEYMIRTFGRRAKYLTSELLDTTFLGEGLYEGLQHAKECLLDRNQDISSPGACPPTNLSNHMIPHSGRVFIQAWSGDCLKGGSSLLHLMTLGINPSSMVNKCTASSASTVQVAPFLAAGAVAISTPVEIFSFDFQHLPRASRRVVVSLPLTANLPVDAIVMFWACCCCSNPLDPSSTANCTATSLICSPSVSCEDIASSCGHCAISTLGFHTIPSSNWPANIVDHWRQAVYFQNRENPLCAVDGRVHDGSREISVECSHDSDDIWVRVIANDSQKHHTQINMSGMHMELSRRPVNELGKRRAAAMSNEDMRDVCWNKTTPECDDDTMSTTRPVCLCGLHATSSCFRYFLYNSDTFRQQLSAISDDILLNLSSEGKRDVMTGYMFLGDNALVPVYCILQLLNWRRGQRETQRGACAGVEANDSIFPCKLVFLFTSRISMRCAISFVTENCCQDDSGDSWQSYVKFVLFDDNAEIDAAENVITSSAIERNLQPYTDLESSSNEIDCVWAKQLLDFMKDTHLHQIYTEPYFNWHSDDWIMKHFVTYCQLLEALQAQHDVSRLHADSYSEPVGPYAIDDVIRSSPYRMDIMCGYFSCRKLWEHYCGAIGDVEGIDMSAINCLMVEGSGYHNCRSVRLSQWGVTALMEGSEVSAGAVTVQDVCGNGDTCLSRRVQLNYDVRNWLSEASTSKDAPSPDIHGIAFYGVFRSLENIISNSDPANSPSSVQSIAFFEKPLGAADLVSSLDIMFRYDLESGDTEITDIIHKAGG